MSQAGAAPACWRRPKLPVGLEQRVLDGVLGIVADQPAGDRVQARELALGENPKAILRGRVARIAHAISSREYVRGAPDIASVDGCTGTVGKRLNEHNLE